MQMDNDNMLLINNSSMSIEEARKVLWLSNNPRPLGELLDEGFLNDSRLRWAAEKAFSQELKLAAQVLLQSLGKFEPTPEVQNVTFSSESFPITTTVEQARNTLWPFPPYKNQMMGGLLDTKQLTLKDLGYAIENAWDERVRQAAITLNLNQLKQTLETPPPDNGFLNVIESKERSYAERRQLALSFIQGALIGALLAGAMALAIFGVTNTKKPIGQAVLSLVEIPYGWGILILAVIVLLGWGTSKLFDFCLGWVIDRLETKINNYRKGQKGENDVVDRMRHLLDGNWHLFRNIVLPGHNQSDIDAVLIGPSGVWALEVKTFNGQFRVIGDQWLYKKKQMWKPLKSDPTRQAVNNAKRLSDYIKNNHGKLWVTPVVIWASPADTLTVENSTASIWRLDQLADEVANLSGNKKILEADQKQLVDKLTQLYSAS